MPVNCILHKLCSAFIGKMLKKSSFRSPPEGKKRIICELILKVTQKPFTFSIIYDIICANDAG